jgi:hypothetical protein
MLMHYKRWLGYHTDHIFASKLNALILANGSDGEFFLMQ